ncbi:MAG: hypothetical protein QXT76_04540 [Sulfolobales archaeon]
MRPSREVSIGLIQTLMSRPPRIHDMLEVALRDLDISVETASQQPGFRLMLVNLRDVKSYEELDRQVRAILENEIGEVVKYLPHAYLDYVKTFFELGELELRCLGSSKTGGAHSATPLSADKDAGVKLATTAYLEHAACREGVEGLLIEYLSRVRSSLSEISEDCSWAYEVIKSLAVLHNFRYLRNAELIGLGSSKLDQFLRLLNLNPLTEILLKRAVDSLGRIDRAGLIKYTIYEAVEALNIANGLLSHRDGLINLLTLYLVIKYYESKILRYVFLPKTLKRW